MSYSLTKRQYEDGSKDITRRLGWTFLRRGDRFRAVEKGMGLKKGEKMVRLGVNVCLENRREPLNAITQADVIREGFPGWTPTEFIAFFCKANKCQPDTLVSRIVFRKIAK